MGILDGVMAPPAITAPDITVPSEPAPLEQSAQAAAPRPDRKGAKYVKGDKVNGFELAGDNWKDKSQWKPVTGEDFLGSFPSLDPDKISIVKAIANYELPPGSQRGGLGSPEVQQLLALAKRYDPTFDAKKYKVRQDFLTDLSKGETAKQIQALNNGSLHARDMLAAYDKLGNWNAPDWINMVKQYGQGYLGAVTGDPKKLQAIGAAKQAAEALAPEAARVYMGSSPNEAEISGQRHGLDVTKAPAYEEGNLADMASKFAQRLLTIQYRYHNAFGKDKMPEQPLIMPESAQALHEILTRYKVKDADKLDWNTLTAGGFSPQQIRSMQGPQKGKDNIPPAPEGVDPRVWAHVRPEKRALWN
jgi:hypothetical protein